MLFAGERDLTEIIEDVAGVGARLLLQTALEAEIDETPGQDSVSAVVHCG